MEGRKEGRREFDSRFFGKFEFLLKMTNPSFPFFIHQKTLKVKTKVYTRASLLFSFSVKDKTSAGCWNISHSSVHRDENIPAAATRQRCFFKAVFQVWTPNKDDKMCHFQIISMSIYPTCAQSLSIRRYISKGNILFFTTFTHIEVLFVVILKLFRNS